MAKKGGTVRFELVSYVAGLSINQDNREGDIAYIAREIGRLELILESMEAWHPPMMWCDDITVPRFAFDYNKTCKELLMEYWKLCNQFNRSQK